MLWSPCNMPQKHGRSAPSSTAKSVRRTEKATLIPRPRDSSRREDGMESDQLLIRRAIDGDERALRQLWSQYAPRIDAVVKRLAGDPDLAADIAQDVWIQIFRALKTYRGDAQFGTWAHRIAVNRTLNALRKVRRLAKVEMDIEDDSVSVEMDSDRSFVAAMAERWSYADLSGWMARASSSAPTSCSGARWSASDLPLTVARPDVALASPIIMRMVVVFPAPLGPRKPVMTPG